ncbi:MAG TPA: zf-HC2 domain-containing protein [Bryobacteraceae bacterium]|jgi:anti-sigma factor RsiW|nr:zf-HC2 domain-containing protein [Bryobacteraceae bacterium]
MAIHPTVQQLDAYSLGLLGGAEAVRVREHLFECVACLERFVAIDDGASGAARLTLVNNATGTPASRGRYHAGPKTGKVRLAAKNRHDVAVAP